MGLHVMSHDSGKSETKYDFCFRLSAVLAHDMKTHRLHYEQHMTTAMAQFFYIPTLLRAVHPKKKLQKPEFDRRLTIVLDKLPDSVFGKNRAATESGEAAPRTLPNPRQMRKGKYG